MSNNLTDDEENRLLDLSWLTTDKMSLTSTCGTDSTAGTEVTGGSYARVTTSSLAAAASGSKSTSADVVFSGMPTVDVVGWGIWNSAGTQRKWYGLFNRQIGSAQATGDTITATAHGLVDTTKIVFQPGATPTGLTAGTTYFVRDSTTNTFKVAATSGGTAIDITADQSITVFGLVRSVLSGTSFTIPSGSITLSLT